MNTTYYLDLVIGNVFHTKATPALPAKYYIGLSSTPPNVNGENVTEPSTIGTGYSRCEMKDLSVPAEGAIHNTTVIRFPESITDWGVMTHYVVYDALTGGNLLFYGQLSKKRTIESNTILAIKAGELKIELTNTAS